MPTDPNPISSIPAARIKIDQTVTRHECPFCGSSHWMPPSDNQALVLYEATLENGVLSEDRTHAVGIGFVCLGCGFLRVHVPTFPDRSAAR